MCHFPTFAVRAPMDSERANPDCSGLGCPIRKSQDRLVCSSPGLIAAYHVLRRLSAPRHPPYTLSNLTALIPLPDDTPTGKQIRCASLRSGAMDDPENSCGSCFNCRTTVLLPRVFPLTSRHPLFNFQRTTSTSMVSNLFAFRFRQNRCEARKRSGPSLSPRWWPSIW